MLRRDFNKKTIEELFEYINTLENASKEVWYAYNTGQTRGPTDTRVEKFHAKMNELREVLFFKRSQFPEPTMQEIGKSA